MFKIETVRIRPIESEPDFVVTALPPGGDFKMGLISRFDFLKKSIGPDEAIENAEKDPTSEETLEFWDYGKAVMQECIQKIEGFEVDGKAVSDLEGFLKYAPHKIIEKVMLEVMKLGQLSEGDKKK